MERLDVGRNIEDIQRIARWWFCRNDRRQRRAMWAASEAGGTISDLVHEVVIALLMSPPPVSVKLSTAVCNQCLWVTGGLLKLARRRRDALGDFTSDQHENPDDTSLEAPHRRELRDAVQAVLNSLTYREREVMKLRWGLGDGRGYTLEETGRVFKVTRERVRQVESKAIRKLMHFTRARRLKGFL